MRWYNLPVWKKVRKLQLNKFPLCALCLKIGRETPATVVDHIEPFKDDWDLFISADNLQSVCKSCHDAQKRMQELHGYSQACDVDGNPIDKLHPWNK